MWNACYAASAEPFTSAIAEAIISSLTPRRRRLSIRLDTDVTQSLIVL